MSVQKGTVFIGLKELNGWMFGCVENDARKFGFVPLNYMEFIKELKKNK